MPLIPAERLEWTAAAVLEANSEWRPRRRGMHLISGEYVEDLARRGLVGYVCCNSQGNGQLVDKLVAPWGGA